MNDCRGKQQFEISLKQVFQAINSLMHDTTDKTLLIQGATLKFLPTTIMDVITVYNPHEFRYLLRPLAPPGAQATHNFFPTPPVLGDSLQLLPAQPRLRDVCLKVKLWLTFGFVHNTLYTLANQALPLPGPKYYFHLLCMFL